VRKIFQFFAQHQRLRFQRGQRHSSWQQLPNTRRQFNLPAQFSLSKDALLTAASAKLRVDTLRLKRLVEFWRGLWPPK
jgi:hypothetical protein